MSPIELRVDDLVGDESLRGTEWSVRVREGASGEVVAEHGPAVRRRTASVAKVLLLLEVASRIEEGSLSPATLLPRESAPPVADSGLWQHLTATELSVADAATLVGSVSDNLATNVLLREVGLDAVARRARGLGVVDAALHDYVRAERTPDLPPTLSEGTAGEWCDIMLSLHARTLTSPAVCARVMDWLSVGVDHSMVAGALHLDPLSHGVDPGSALRVWSKTGTDDGVRADVGVMTKGAAAVGYAVICTWDPEGPVRVADVLSAMRDIGDGCARVLGGVGDVTAGRRSGAPRAR